MELDKEWIDVDEIPDFRPTPGTLIFFDWGQDGLADHVGIVERCRRGTVYAIEGNSGDRVTNRYYMQDSAEIMGYGDIKKCP